MKRQMNHANGQELGTNKGFYTWNYYLLGADGSQIPEYRAVQVQDSVRFYPEYYLANGGMISLMPDSLGTMQYNFYDLMGTMRMRITRNKNSRINEWNNVEYFDYSQFGEIMARYGDTSKPDKIGFIGKELDEENSYFLLGVRQYDPKIGRFLSVDPLWESFRNYNPYHYSYNNPVSFKDPTGLAPEITILRCIRLGYMLSLLYHK